MLTVNEFKTKFQYDYYPEIETLKIKVPKQIEQADFVALIAFLFEETKRVYTFTDSKGTIRSTETLVKGDKVTNVELELY